MMMEENKTNFMEEIRHIGSNLVPGELPVVEVDEVEMEGEVEVEGIVVEAESVEVEAEAIEVEVESERVEEVVESEEEVA